MQAAVDCNGSNSTTTTTTTTASTSNITDNIHQQEFEQTENILLNRLLAGKIPTSISSSLNNEHSHDCTVTNVADQYDEFIPGSPSKAVNKPKLLSSSLQFSNTVFPNKTQQSVTAATTPTLSSTYNSCNSSLASTPSPTETTISSTHHNAPLLPYPSVSSAIGDSNYDELLQWKDMPRYLQFNPYVINGYRPLTTFRGCVLSLFYWHNETINILTHGIPIFYILAVVPGLMPWENGYRFLSFCHVFGSLAPWCGSFVYHLFMNIEMGEDVYYRLLKLDMVGIWVSQSFGALPLITATTLCFTFTWKWCIIISYCLLSLWGLYKALTASSPWQRRLCFALPFTMRSILTFLRTIGVVGGNRIAMSHVYLQDGVSILGGAIGAMRIPEKWFPGLVDYYLNSHNIMHVLVVVAVYSMHQATTRELAWMSTAQCGPLNVTNETIDSSPTINSNEEL